MPDINFEDLRPGEVSTFGRHVVDRDAMVAFAREFDAQPFHLSEEEAAGTLAGRLIASGWYSCALLMRLLCEGWLLRAASLGAPGIEEVRWLKPVVAGDVLGVRQTILDVQPSRSRPDRGLVRFSFELLDEAGEAVLTQRNVIGFARRGAPPAEARPPAPALPGADAALLDAPEGVSFPDFEAVEIGAAQRLGAYAFTRENVVAFARAFDPQPFHLDEAAARAGPFGGLAASGWHTASAWMGALVRHRQAAAAAAEAAGRPVPRFGVSPGFQDLRWLRPVRPGDTLVFATTATDKRPSASRPGWGIVWSRSFAVNGAGETVFEFAGSGFYARRDAG